MSRQGLRGSAIFARPGSVYRTEFEPCEAHAEDGGDDDRAECQNSVREVVEEMAQWKWPTVLRINEIAFGRDGREFSRECHFEQWVDIATTYQDSREFVVGPPGHGQAW